MKHKFLQVIVGCSLLLSAKSVAGKINVLDAHSKGCINVYPESGKVENLDLITVTSEASNKFGAFIYMPALYKVEKNGVIGKEVSTCELIDASARGRDTLKFRVLTPPTEPGKYTFIIKILLKTIPFRLFSAATKIPMTHPLQDKRPGKAKI